MGLPVRLWGGLLFQGRLQGRPEGGKDVSKRICPWCRTEREDDAGAYYHEHACHAKDVRRRIKENEKEREALGRELEQAEYVGD